ncbi:hypothetical protein SAMD00019534_101100 [Acytostelium subglobosum LB1]|uniref:hypothetical protein n=1 Tax=Acytostelium subglobosum LB1 TaxID=1410327 RepID=UPI000644EDA1|nr:hypothetical protein SAMD00019534_101100 [Acytostelium subglobosum LB1]GAM26935.1 hypothetical protein SAMD00019534_101100 [Acytostelium subglobosum LB1]|eukprot:XP_012750203.1 hypothetical protein SAMD00019534_101100 [Acytostelium subglobosum LB1]
MPSADLNRKRYSIVSRHVAIKHGNKDVIEFIKQHNLKQDMNIDVDDALSQAVDVCDLESIRWLLTCRSSTLSSYRWEYDHSQTKLDNNHMCKLLEHVDEKITQDEIIDLLNKSTMDDAGPNTWSMDHLSGLLEVAASKSLSVIMMVFKHFVATTGRERVGDRMVQDVDDVDREDEGEGDWVIAKRDNDNDREERAGERRKRRMKEKIRPKKREIQRDIVSETEVDPDNIGFYYLIDAIKVVLSRGDFDSLEYLLQRTRDRPCVIIE